MRNKMEVMVSLLWNLGAYLMRGHVLCATLERYFDLCACLFRNVGSTEDGNVSRRF